MNRDDILSKVKQSGNKLLYAESYKLQVDEWGGEIYFKHPSIADQDKYNPYFMDGKLEGYAEMIVQLVLKGPHSKQKMFQKEDKQTFTNNSDPKFIQRIGEEMLRIIGNESIDEAEAEKNLPMTDD